MDQLVCPHCDELNPPGTEFCTSCRRYLWDAEAVHGPPESPNFSVSASALSVSLDSDKIVVNQDRAWVSVHAKISNLSGIVEGYVFEAVAGPAWLEVREGSLRLFPGEDGEATLSVRPAGEELIPAQEAALEVVVVPKAQPDMRFSAQLALVVPVIDAPIELRLEPNLVRVRDSDDGELAIVASNHRSNETVIVHFIGKDDEGIVSFRFTPQRLEIPPGGSQRSLVQVRAPHPEPGDELSHRLTVLATNGTHVVEAGAVFSQSSSPLDPPVTVTIEPKRLTLKDGSVGDVQVIVNNATGRLQRKVTLSGSDADHLVKFTFRPQVLELPAGGTAAATVTLQAPLPDPGLTLSREIWVSAADESQKAEGVGELVQIASASPIETLDLRLEPDVVRVADTGPARFQLVVENLEGRAGIRLTLSGRDPERVARFRFAPQVLVVPPGGSAQAGVEVEVPPLPAGDEVHRPLTIIASDGRRRVEATASLVQSTSPPAIEDLRLKLEPEVLRVRGAGWGQLSVVLDNRRGRRPLRVSLTGDDPEKILRFVFKARSVDLGPGQLSRVRIRVRAPRPSAGQEMSRDLTIKAVDGAREVLAEGRIIQHRPVRRPLARIIFTVAGALAMIMGVFLPWVAGVSLGGFGWSLDIFEQLFGDDTLVPLDDPIEKTLSAGLVFFVLAGLIVFGLLGPKGRLTRWAALAGVIAIVAFFVVVIVRTDVGTPDFGMVLIALGCIGAYIGGALADR